MSTQIESKLFTKEIFALLEEIFAKVHGIILDGGTSLTETLEKISANEASRPTTETGTSITSQVDHVRFYLQVLNDYIDGKRQEKIDWQGSWKRKSVSESEWNSLRQQVKDDYKILMERLNSITDWNDERRLGGALGILAHTAYHLGAIRQIMGVAKR